MFELLGCLWQSIGRPGEFVLVDATGEQPTAHVVFVRRWFSEGFRLKTFDRLEDAVLVLSQHEVHLVVVITEGGRVAESVDPLYDCAGERHSTIQVTADGAALRAGILLDSEEPTFDDDHTLTVKGSRDEVFRGFTVPLSIEIEWSGNPLAWVVGLTVSGVEEYQAPEPAWFRVETHGDARASQLTVDIEPRMGATDSWNPQLAGARLRRIDRSDRLPAHDRRPSRLGVLLDRTCPDLDHWSRAKRLAERGLSRDADATSFNLAVRQALGDALRVTAGAGAGPVMIDAAWFADTHGPGLAPPEGIDLPQRGFAITGESPADACARLFTNMTYVPGLDLWDQLGEALDALVARVERDNQRVGRVLIVGNSPPRVPGDTNSPIFELLEQLPAPTSFREPSSAWHDALSRCQRQGIPVVYLFLTHDVTDHDTNALLSFQEVHEQVAAALERCPPLMVVRGPADTDGVARGVEEAWRLLTHVDRSPSSVRIAR